MGIDFLLMFWEIIRNFVVGIFFMKEAWIAGGVLIVLAMYKWKVTFQRRL